MTCDRAFRVSRGMPVLYVVPADNREPIEARVSKLNRKAVKLGVPGVVVTFAHHHTETWNVEKVSGSPELGFNEFAREWLGVTLSGASVRLGGWEFIATLHHTTDGNIIAAVPGHEVPREYRNAPSACAHCRTARRRSATYLLSKETAGGPVTMQVGADCLQDFLGNDPHRMAAWAEALGAFNSWFLSTSEEERGPRRADTFSLGSFLDAVAAHIRIDGWVSRKRAQESEESSTASNAWSWLVYVPMDKYGREHHRKFTPTAEDTTKAKDALLWAVETFGEVREDRNDYEHNLGVVVRSGLVNLRVAGLAASILQAHRRATTVAEEKKAAADAPESNHVGAVGDRLRDVPVKVVAVIPMPPTEYGPRELVKLSDEAGNIFAWFTGALGTWVFPARSTEGLDGADADAANEENVKGRSPEPGDSMWLTGTVKAHNSFNSVKQTVLSRCALASFAPEPKKAKRAKKVAV